MNTIPVLDCIRCGAPLSYRSIRARSAYCEKCGLHPRHRVEQVQMADKGGKVRAVLVRVAI